MAQKEEILSKEKVVYKTIKDDFEVVKPALVDIQNFARMTAKNLKIDEATLLTLCQNKMAEFETICDLYVDELVRYTSEIADFLVEEGRSMASWQEM